jgi:hypothetical protein
MNFIETLLGVSPDGGSGSLELLYLMVPVVFAVLAFRKVRSRGW